MAARTPEPGYVLFISCPAAAVNVVGRLAGRLEVDLRSNMGQVCAVLQEGLGATWGSMPSAWRAVAKKDSTEEDGPNASAASGRAAQQRTDSRHRRSGQAEQPFRQSQLQQPPKQQLVLPVHGLQMSSKTRSLASMQVGDSRETI